MAQTHFFLAWVFLAGIAVGEANAQSLKSMRAQQQLEQTLIDEAKFTSGVCKAPIEASIDWTSIASWPEQTSLAAACDAALGAVEAYCREGADLQFNQFVCAGDGSGPRLSAMILRYGAHPRRDGFAEMRAFLGSQR